MKNETFIIYTLFQDPKTPPTQSDTLIPIKQPKFGLWNLNILEVFERYSQNLRKNIRILE